jgi:Arc/MetJ family transcription regulator
MRTTVTIDESLVTELMRLSGAKNKTAAVSQAVREQIRKAKLQQLADLLGKIEVDEDAVREGDRADLERAAWLSAGTENGQ